MMCYFYETFASCVSKLKYRISFHKNNKKQYQHIIEARAEASF